MWMIQSFTRYLSLAAVIAGLAAPAGPVAAEDAVATDALQALGRDRVDGAIDRGVTYLLSQQDDNGRINDRGNENGTAMTSLAIMAMAATGHQPSDPTPQGRAMRDGLDYVLEDSRQDERGYFGNSDGSRMYGHGITTLMLGEMVGHGTDARQDALIRQRCRAGVDLILEAQRVPKHSNQDGGWRYTPDARDADLSVTIWQLMALRSAHNAGLDVPAEAIDDAVAYLRASYHSQERDEAGRPLDLNSGFGYQPGRHPTTSLAAMGMLAMIVCGEYEAPEVVGASNYLLDNPPEFGDQWFFYSIYYYSQGMYQRGGTYATTARDLVERVLLDRQRDDGSWTSHGGAENNAGAVYATSMAILSLAVKHHYLPIYQR